MSKKILQVPYGTKDILPGEARALRNMTERILGTFDTWGYAEVVTPTFEYLDTFTGSGQSANQISGSNFKFFDRNNNILMLRTDMTTPIARLVATRLQGEPGIKRLSYQAKLFRYEDAQAGKQCEFIQCGIEMMGAAGASADAEVIALAVNALLEAGLTDFTISMGQIEFINGLAEAAALNEEQTQAVKRCLITRNVVGLEEVVNANRIPEQLANIFKELLFLHGGEELLETMRGKVLSKRCWSALENLQEIYDLTKAYGVEKYLSFDLGLIRDFDYYTGMIFEGYTGSMGYPIIGGGRYDKMMQGFGRAMPATGFAMGIDRIMLAMERSGSVEINKSFDLLVAYGPGKVVEAIRACTDLRQQGQSVRLAGEPVTDEAAAAKQAEENCCLSYTYIK